MRRESSDPTAWVADGRTPLKPPPIMLNKPESEVPELDWLPLSLLSGVLVGALGWRMVVRPTMMLGAAEVGKLDELAKGKEEAPISIPECSRVGLTGSWWCLAFLRGDVVAVGNVRAPVNNEIKPGSGCLGLKRSWFRVSSVGSVSLNPCPSCNRW